MGSTIILDGGMTALIVIVMVVATVIGTEQFIIMVIGRHVSTVKGMVTFVLAGFLQGDFNISIMSKIDIEE